MTEVEAMEAILERWESGWDAIHPQDPNDPDYVPYVYDNEAADATAVWVHLAVEPTVRTRTTQSQDNACHEARGIVRVRIFGPVDTGAAQIAQLAVDAIGVLEETRIDDLILRAGSQRPGPTDGRWAMRVVTVPYSLYQRA